MNSTTEKKLAARATELGNAPAQKLFNLVKVEKNCGEKPPRSFSDYMVSVGDAPDGVEKIEML
jgi:CRISPR-associated protein Csd2